MRRRCGASCRTSRRGGTNRSSTCRTTVEVDAALEFLDKHNRTRPPDRPATLFHLLLRAISQGLALRPRCNRFVKGGRLWQRRGIYLTFSAKRELSPTRRPW